MILVNDIIPIGSLAVATVLFQRKISQQKKMHIQGIGTPISSQFFYKLTTILKLNAHF